MTRSTPSSRKRVLAVRSDSIGDVLLTGPALRAIAASADVTLLCGPRGIEAARLLPGIDSIVCAELPWIDPEPKPVTADGVRALVATLSAVGAGEAVIFASFHQSALPLALAMRVAGVPRIAAISDDYPGSLLDVRHRDPGDVHEVERALALAGAAGYALPRRDDGALRIVDPGPRPQALEGVVSYVVVHPGASVPARAWPLGHAAELVRRLRARGRDVVVTGGRDETSLTAAVAVDGAIDLGGRLTLRELASVTAGASAIVAGNTGPAHLAAAVGTPVVSLFAPVVSAVRWRPWRVPHVLLGDQSAPCAGTRARQCPVAGHPCLASVTPDDVLAALDALSAVEAVA
jgi:ADP-heptose:LPS heptosyltransferase